MSTTRTSVGATPTGRTRAHTWAAILNLLASLAAIGLSLPLLFAGAATTDAAGDQPPFAIIVLSLVLGVVGVVSSWGVWQRQRWGVVLTIVVNALNFLSGVPGVIFGPTAFLVIGSIVGCIVNIVIIYLLLRRTSARAQTVARA